MSSHERETSEWGNILTSLPEGESLRSSPRDSEAVPRVR